MNVRDAMTPSPVSVALDTPVGEVMRALVRADFQSVSVVDDDGRPLGMITQTDLLARGDVPLLPGLLSDTEPVVNARLARLGTVAAAEIMTTDLVTVHADEDLDDAVDTLFHRDLKRLPVVDDDGVLVGMLSRTDVLHTTAF